VIKNLSVNVLKDSEVDKRFIHNIVKELKNELEFELSGIQINFVNSAEIMRINKVYLNHNYSTDIITFDYSGSQKMLDGEIYISIEDAAFNARKFGVKLKEEIMRLVIHGFLHLLGFNDKSQKDKIVMKEIENKLFNKYRLVII